MELVTVVMDCIDPARWCVSFYARPQVILTVEREYEVRVTGEYKAVRDIVRDVWYDPSSNDDEAAFAELDEFLSDAGTVIDLERTLQAQENLETTGIFQAN